MYNNIFLSKDVRTSKIYLANAGQTSKSLRAKKPRRIKKNENNTRKVTFQPKTTSTPLISKLYNNNGWIKFYKERIMMVNTLIEITKKLTTTNPENVVTSSRTRISLDKPSVI